MGTVETPIVSLEKLDKTVFKIKDETKNDENILKENKGLSRLHEHIKINNLIKNTFNITKPRKDYWEYKQNIYDETGKKPPSFFYRTFNGEYAIKYRSPEYLNKISEIHQSLIDNYYVSYLSIDPKNSNYRIYLKGKQSLENIKTKIKQECDPICNEAQSLR